MSHLSQLWQSATIRYSQLKKTIFPAASSNLAQTNLMEATLLESEAFYRQMFERNHAVKLVIDPITAQIIEANRAACDFYGYTPEQFKALRMTDIAIAAESEVRIIMQRIATEKGTTFQAQHRLASGAVRDVEVFAGLLEVNNKRYLYGIIQDITEHKRAEKALRESEASYRLLAQHMPNTSVIMFDRDMRYTLAVGPHLKRFGEIWNNAIGKLPQEFLVGESLNFILPIYQRALHGESFTYERMTSEFAYQSYAAPVRDENGQIIGGMILSHDITERKQAEKALHESEVLYRLFMQHMPNTSVLMFDNNMRFTLAEGDFLKRVGLVPENMIGKTPQEVFSEETLNFMQPIYQRVLKGETFTYDRTTAEYAYQAYANPLKNADGQIIGGMFLSHDITDLKRSEAAFRASEARFHSLVDLAPVGIIQTDLQGKRVFCNTRWCEMTGITLEEALSDENYETIYPDDLNIAAGAWDNMMETHLPFDNVIFRYQRLDKTAVWVSGNGRPLYNAQGEISGYIGSVTDITEIRSTQEELRQERDLIRTVIDHMPDYIFLKDTEGRFVLTNTAHAEAAGSMRPSDLIGKTAFDVFSSDLARQFHADDQALMQFGESLINAERETVDARGNHMTVLTTKIPWHDSNGQILGLIGISRDITERKQLEEALLTSESRFRTLIDFAPVGIVETDAHGSLILGNARWHALSAIPETYEFADNASGTIHPDDLARIQAIHQTMLETADSVDNLEYRFVHPDGKMVWVSDSSRPLLDPNDVITGYIVTMTDITERKRLEEALRQNQERLQIITDNIQDLITQSDAKGHFLFVNPSYQTILGYEPGSLIGKSSIEHVHPDDLGRLTQIIQTATVMGKQHFTVESRLRHADGHYINVETVGKLLFDSQSNYAGGVFISRDISERKRLQNLLLDKEKLQTALDKELELNNLKTRMMNRIAHEFRTPLTVIQATTETLTHYLDRLTPEQRDTKEVTIKGQIQRLTDMLDEIGQVIKTDFTRDRVHRTSTDLSIFCRQIATQVERELNQPAKFVFELPETAEVSVDPQVLNNAFMQVMHNAARFSKPDAIVKISLTPVKNGIKLCVTDTGIGILSQEQPRLFEPFFRGSNIGESSGLGVGLTMARAAIEAHGGTITIESVIGQGTTVTIWIPV